MLMTKTSAAVAVAAMCATLQGASADSARYIRIYHLADSPAQILNLDEVMPYDCAGRYVQPVAARMAAPIRGWPASNCINNRPIAGGVQGCHSSNVANSWLEVDLGRVMSISQVVVRNRVSCCSDRILGYSIALFTGANATGMTSFPQLFADVQNVYTFSFNDGGCPTNKDIATFAELGMSRYITIWRNATGIINLAEIQAYDCNNNLITPESISMTSVHPAGPGTRCIDNSTSSRSSFCHTLNRPNQSLMVDLGRYARVSYVVVTNRIDCCQNRIQGYNIGLFAGPGYAPTVPYQMFVSTAPVYTFNFGECTSVLTLDSAVSGLSAQLGFARYLRIWNTGVGILNLNEVVINDCSGNRIVPAFALLSSAHGRGPAYSCINNLTTVRTEFCHSNNASNNWLEIDLGYAQPVGSVVVYNRIDCCAARIIGFNIGLFNAPGGVRPVGTPSTFTANQPNYTFTGLTSCINVPAVSTQASTNTATLANTNTTHLTTSLNALQRLIAQESSALAALNAPGTGGLAGAVTSVTSTAALASTNIASLSTNVGTQSTTTSSLISTVESAAASQAQTQSAAVNTLSNTLTALQSSIRTAVNMGPGLTTPVPQPQFASVGSRITVSGGQCNNNDLCDAASFAANLKNSLSNL